MPALTKLLIAAFVAPLLTITTDTATVSQVAGSTAWLYEDFSDTSWDAMGDCGPWSAGSAHTCCSKSECGDDVCTCGAASIAGMNLYQNNDAVCSLLTDPLCVGGGRCMKYTYPTDTGENQCSFMLGAPNAVPSPDTFYISYQMGLSSGFSFGGSSPTQGDSWKQWKIASSVNPGGSGHTTVINYNGDFIPQFQGHPVCTFVDTGGIRCTDPADYYRDFTGGRRYQVQFYVKLNTGTNKDGECRLRITPLSAGDLDQGDTFDCHKTNIAVVSNRANFGDFLHTGRGSSGLGYLPFGNPSWNAQRITSPQSAFMDNLCIDSTDYSGSSHPCHAAIDSQAQLP